MLSQADQKRGFASPLALAALLGLGVLGGVEREIEVAVWTVASETVTGRLVSFSLRGGAVVQANGESQTSRPGREGLRSIPIADIIRITRRVASPQDASDRAADHRDREAWTVTLAWGDVLSGRVKGSVAESVIMETADLGDVALPIEAISRMATARSASGVHRESVQWLDRGGRANEDRVLLTNGDVLRGFISAIDADGIAIDTGTGPTKAPFRLVVAAQLAHPPVDPDAPQRPYAILTLRDGARLTATGLDWVDAGCEARLRTGATVRIEVDRLVAADVIGGRWEWLSEHRPVSYEQAPMLGLGWEFFADRSVLGGPILVAGQRYDRGIGVHSRSNLVFELNGAYQEFATSFGMDDDSGPLADVTVVILVDGQRRFEKAHVRRGTLFGPVRVDVAHAGRIELIVDYGDNGDLQDRFDWVEPGLIR